MMFWKALVAMCVVALPALAADPCADYTPQAKPQNATRDIVGQELDQIVDQGFMTFAVYDAYPPYSWKDGSTPRGVDIDIARLIAADLRDNIWQGGIIGGAVSNVMMRVPYDSAFACRVEQVVFTGQYMGEGIAIAYANDKYPEDPPVPAYFRFDTVAVENDSIADFYLSGLAGGQLSANISRFADMEQVMDALANGDVMAAMGPRSQLEHGLTDAIAIHEPPLPGFSVGHWTLGVGVNFRYRALSYAVDDAIRYALDDGRIARIFDDYGLSFRSPER